MSNLFEMFSVNSFPNEINLPTQKRLKRFLKEELQINAKKVPEALIELKVRDIVDRMFKFESSGMLAWDHFAGHASSLQGASATASQYINSQTIYARCAAEAAKTISRTWDARKGIKNKSGTLKRRATKSFKNMPTAGDVHSPQHISAAASSNATDWSLNQVLLSFLP